MPDRRPRERRPADRLVARLSGRGVTVAGLSWALYTVAYAVAVSIFAGVPLVYAVESQVVQNLILATLSVPVWLVVVRGLDGQMGRQLAAHLVALPLYAVGGTALFLGVYALRDAGAAAQVADQFGWIALGAGTVYVAQFAVYHALAVSQRAQREREAAERFRARAREQELRSLRAQLNPHFLFNALTAVSAEVGRDPDEAREMLGQLGGLLRYSLASGERDLVPLAEEVAFVRDYLALEGARMGDRLRATVDVSGEALGAEVPPMALQTLVENAVRHGLAPKPEGGALAVTARVEGDDVQVRVEDTGVGADPAALAAADGVGLANTDERLRLLFGTGIEVEADRPAGFAVSFCLPLHDDGPPAVRVAPIPEPAVA